MNTHRNTFITITIWSLFVIVSSIGGFFLHRIYSRDTEALSLASEAKNLLKKDEQLSVVRASLRESSQSIDTLETFFVKEDSVSSFIDSLDILAAREGVSVSFGSLSVEPVPDSTLVKQLKLRASVTGTWKHVVSFTSALESLPQAVVVQIAAFNREPETSEVDQAGVVRWNAGLNVSVLILPN